MIEACVGKQLECHRVLLKNIGTKIILKVPNQVMDQVLLNANPYKNYITIINNLEDH